MSDKSNNPFQFWEELKRRRVVRVIPVYAAAAFVILELVDIISEPFGLPDWTLKLVVVLLSIGFIVSIILSWIYDVTPEGIEKTKSSGQNSYEAKQITSRGWKISTYISGLVIVVFIVFYIIGNIERSSDIVKLEKTIAVLPFENMSDSEDHSFFGDAMTDEIIMQLYKIKEFTVRSRTSVTQYKGTVKTIPTIGQELNVNYLIEGSAQRFEDQVRIRVQLLNTITDVHIWGDIFEGDWDDILTLQGDIAEQIALELKTVLSLQEIDNIKKNQTDNLEAYELFLLGMNYFNNYSNDKDLYKAIEYFNRAINKDSTYALAYASLAEIYYMIFNFYLKPPNEVLPLVKEYSMRALELNDNLANAHYSLGNAMLIFDYDPVGAEKQFIRAIEINPNSSRAHLFYALYLSLMGMNDEAMSHANYLLELDPLSKVTSVIRLQLLFNAGFQTEAMKLAEDARDSDPTWFNWYWRCAVIYTELEMFQEALSMLDIQIKLMKDDNISDELGLLGYLYGKLGQTDEAQKQLDHLNKLSAEETYISLIPRYMIYLGLEDFDKALETLEKAYYEHSFSYVSFDLTLSNIYNPIRNDPRFLELLKKVGF